MRKVCCCFTFTTANRYPIPTTQFYADRTPKVDVEKLKDIFENKQESLKIFEGKYQKLRHTREEMKKNALEKRPRIAADQKQRQQIKQKAAQGK